MLIYISALGLIALVVFIIIRIMNQGAVARTRKQAKILLEAGKWEEAAAVYKDGIIDVIESEEHLQMLVQDLDGIYRDNGVNIDFSRLMFCPKKIDQFYRLKESPKERGAKIGKEIRNARIFLNRLPPEAGDSEIEIPTEKETYSSSTTPKYRSQLVKMWLFFAFLINGVLFVVNSGIMYFLLRPESSTSLSSDFSATVSAVEIINALLNLVCLVALAKWKKWGFAGFLGVNLLITVVHVAMGKPGSYALFSVIGGLILFALLKRDEGKDGWVHLEP